MYSTNYGSKSIDHLGLVAGFCESIGLQEYIDNLIPKKSNQSGLSHGTLLTAMILNGLGFVSRTLHMYPEYFSEKATEGTVNLTVFDASKMKTQILGAKELCCSSSKCQ